MARQAELKDRYQAKFDRHPLDWVNEVMAELGIKEKHRLLPVSKEGCSPNHEETKSPIDQTLFSMSREQS